MKTALELVVFLTSVAMIAAPGHADTPMLGNSSDGWLFDVNQNTGQTTNPWTAERGMFS